MAVTYNYGAAPTYVKIASATISNSTTTTYTFSNIPQGYTDLRIVFNGGQTTDSPLYLYFNGDTGSNYSVTVLQGDGSTATSTRLSGWSPGIWMRSELIPDAALTGIATFDVMSYSNPTIYKSVLFRANNSALFLNASCGSWRNTSPITSVSFINNNSGSYFQSGSTFNIYGIKAAFIPKAAGGDLIFQSGAYWYHVFNNSANFVTKQALTADYLIIAGGGGGGYPGNTAVGGGGGGAGGMRSTVSATGGGAAVETALSLTTNTIYPVVVGAGGVPGYSATAGGNSSFGGITSLGGGRGGGPYSGSTLGTGGVGGSGGGAAEPAQNASWSGGAGTTGQGYAGGTANGNTAGGVGANGGGAGGVGASTVVYPTATVAAAANGASNNITGLSVTYATGGRGGQPFNGLYYGNNGTPNLGNGGDGSIGGWSTANVGNGGSGVVIVRYSV